MLQGLHSTSLWLFSSTFLLVAINYKNHTKLGYEPYIICSSINLNNCSKSFLSRVYTSFVELELMVTVDITQLLNLTYKTMLQGLHSTSLWLFLFHIPCCHKLQKPHKASTFHKDSPGGGGELYRICVHHMQQRGICLGAIYYLPPRHTLKAAYNYLIS